jgi:hypothetical protein
MLESNSQTTWHILPNDALKLLLHFLYKGVMNIRRIMHGGLERKIMHGKMQG